MVGGPLPFHVPEDILKLGADIVVKGEAELAVPMLLEALKRGESGIVIETPQKPDLEQCVPPRYVCWTSTCRQHGGSVFPGMPFSLRILRYYRYVRTGGEDKVAAPNPEGAGDSLRSGMEKGHFFRRRQLHRKTAQNKGTAKTTHSVDGSTRLSI